MSERRRIYLMRHAQVRYFGTLDPEQVVLTEDGRRQAAAAAEALAEVTFDRVVTSGLVRTLETASIVAPGIEPEARYGLREIESGELRHRLIEGARRVKPRFDERRAGIAFETVLADAVAGWRPAAGAPGAAFGGH